MSKSTQSVTTDLKHQIDTAGLAKSVEQIERDHHGKDLRSRSCDKDLLEDPKTIWEDNIEQRSCKTRLAIRQKIKLSGELST